MNNHLCADNRLFNITPRPFLKHTGLLLALADNILNAFGKLGDIPLLHILADLHRLFQLIEVGCFIREDNNRLVVHLRVHNKTLLRCAEIVACDRDDAQPHTTRGRAVQRFVNVLVVGEIILIVLKLLGGINFPKDRLRNAGDDLCAVHNRIANVNGNVLFLVSEEGIGIAVARNVVLRQQPFQRLSDRGAKSDLICADVINHQDRDVVDVRFDILNVAHKVEKLENTDILLLKPIVIVCRCLAAVDDPANGALKEGMYRVIEQVERNKGILVLVLHLLRRLLEAGQHGAFTARQMLAGVPVLADLSKHFLNDDELIRDKREGCGKLRAVREALDVQHGIVEGIKVFKYGVFLVVDHLE